MKSFLLILFFYLLSFSYSFANNLCPLVKDENTCKQNKCEWKENKCFAPTNPNNPTEQKSSEEPKKDPGMLGTIMDMIGGGSKKDPSVLDKKDEKDDMMGKAKEMASKMSKKEKKPNCLAIPLDACHLTKGCVRLDDLGKCVASEDLKKLGKTKK